jgi:hypothetical protein
MPAANARVELEMKIMRRRRTAKRTTDEESLSALMNGSQSGGQKLRAIDE